MSELFTFALPAPETDSDGRVTARIVPFGVKVPNPNGPGTVSFEADSLTVPDRVPFRITHNAGPGEDVLDRIGFVNTVTSTDQAAFASIDLVDTSRAQDARTLMSEGLADEVSVGVRDVTVTGGVLSGTLDHVALVGNAAFGQESRVLQVFEKEGTPMGEETPTEAPVEVAEERKIMMKFDADVSEAMAKVDAFSARLTEIADAVGEPKMDTARFDKVSPVEALTHLTAKNAGIDTADFALEDIIGDLGTADASGLYYDEYWGAGLQHLLDRRRPLFTTAGAAPFPSTGENLVVPRVTQATAVTAHSGEKAAVGSQALQVEKNSFPTVWFTGAVDIAIELISQGYSVLPTVVNDMLTQYAAATEADATTKLAAAATHTGAALDTATYGGLVADLIATSDLIEDATGVAGDMAGVTPAQWIAILSLMDGGDRRQFAMVNPQNADGSGSLTTRGIDVGGIFVYRAKNATTALQYNQQSYKAGEKSPMQLASTNVELFGRDIGIGGATVNVFWPAGVYSYEV